MLTDTNLVGTPVTGRIDLDSEEVEDRGGKLVWVVGEDASASGFITRDGLHTDGIPYNYGDHAGLHGRFSEFACGQEAAVVAKYRAYDRAVTGPVTPDDVRSIGTLFDDDAGVRVAPFQA